MQRKDIYNEFELEMWLYLDNSLPEDRMEFWRGEINNDSELQKLIQDAEETIDEYNSVENIDLDERTFNRMIDAATSKETIFQKMRSFFTDMEEKMIPKLAFGSILIIATLTILILSSKPNPINKITNSAFGWEDEILDNKFANINTKISLLENEDLRKYYQYSRTKDEWDREIIAIDNELNILFEKTESREL